MSERGESEQKPSRKRPNPRGRGGRPPRGGRAAGPPGRPGNLSVRRRHDGSFEIVHPRCVAERELDYQDGVELLKAGDVEAARDAFRYALQGCGDNLWIHVALGRVALEHFHDPTLARGHFGYAFELAQRALPRGFAGPLARDLPANQPAFEAIEGLAACYEALGRPKDADDIRRVAAQWAGAQAHQ